MAIDLTGVGPGFADPVQGSQQVFRGVLAALARPGTVVDLPGAGGFGAEGAIGLALLDFETPVWLGEDGRPDFATWLRFHCGCPMAATPGGAAFAFLAAADLPGLDRFHAGDAKYPDTAATLVIAVPALTGGLAVALEGPGIAGRTGIAPQGLGAGFWAEAIANRAQFQLGLDLLLAAETAIIGLPRSTRISMEG